VEDMPQCTLLDYTDDSESTAVGTKRQLQEYANRGPQENQHAAKLDLKISAICEHFWGSQSQILTSDAQLEQQDLGQVRLQRELKQAQIQV
jgi:hypothetical protein